MPREEVTFHSCGLQNYAARSCVVVLAYCFTIHALNEPKVHTNQTLGSIFFNAFYVIELSGVKLSENGLWEWSGTCGL